MPEGSRFWLALAVVIAALAGCSSGAPAEVTAVIDGGSATVALLGETVVAAAPGSTVTVTHAGDTVSGVEAPVTHALVAAAADSLPPLFDRGAGGLVPNPAVWGSCQGGDVAAARGGCPLQAGEGPEAWDGQTYWSLGAMLPGEQRHLQLAGDIPTGDHVLVCALHPRLRVVVRVGDAAGATTVQPAAGDAVGRAEQAARQGEPPPDTVTAGIAVEDPAAFVAALHPATIRVRAGEAVTWRAGARAPVDVVFGARPGELSLSHTAPADGLPEGEATGWDGRGVLRSGFLSADPGAGASAAAWTVTFTVPGTYRYTSRFGEQMSGTVVVQEGPR